MWFPQSCDRGPGAEPRSEGALPSRPGQARGESKATPQTTTATARVPQLERERTMASSQHGKATRFRALHEGPGAFVIPNPWDAGSARLLAGLGFQALATSSGASAGVLGKRDGRVSREEALANARLIAGAVDLPVIGDLEKGFGDSP